MHNLQPVTHTMYQAPIFVIKQMIIMPTKKYQPIYNRAYTLNVESRSLAQLQDALRPYNDSMAPKTISDSVVAKSIPDMIEINPAASKTANIPYGWETVRFRFILEVEYMAGGQRFIHYYQGYSEYADQSYKGSIDPMVTWYINSVNTVAVEANPVTGMPMYSGQHTYQLLRSESGLNMVELDTLDNKLIRPVDVLKTIDLELTYAKNPGEKLINKTADLRNDVSLVNNRVNNNPYSYFSTVINSVAVPYVGALDTGMAFQFAERPNELYHSAHLELKAIGSERYLDNFLSLLGKCTYRTRAEDFTLNDLAKMDPQISTKIKLIEPQAQDLGSFVTTDYTADTLNPTIENITAIHIANMVPSLMTMFMLTKCHFTFSNANAFGEQNIFVSANSIFQGLNLPDAINRLEIKLGSTLIPKITKQGLIQVECEVDTDMLGDTNISLSINGGPQFVYRFPTFADGLYAPVITNSMESQTVTNDFKTLLSECFRTDTLADAAPTTIPNIMEY